MAVCFMACAVQGFGVPLVRKFAHSILLCLDLLFRNRLIHCDLKPENVLLKQAGRSGIKVLPLLIQLRPLVQWRSQWESTGVRAPTETP